MLIRLLLVPRGAHAEVRIPTSHRERRRGLRGGAPAPMLFDRTRSVHTFGMREPIVVTFLDRGLRAIRVCTVPPRRVVWEPRARHVLEAPAGTDLRPGDVLQVVPATAASR